MNCALWLNKHKIYSAVEIADNLDIAALRGYFLAGSLVEWLCENGGAEYAKKLSRISPDDSRLNEKLAEVFGGKPLPAKSFGNNSPALHGRAKRKNGVSNLLCGFCSLDEAIQKNVRDNLDVLPAGEIPPNPAELTATDIFGNVIAELKQKYDYIFIDTPPVTVVTDAAIIMKHSMGVVMVVRHNVTTFDILDNAMEAIKNAGVKVLGVIMLGAEDKGKKYGYYKSRKHGYKYKYGYGYEYGYSYEYKDEGENSESLTTPNAKRS